MCVCDVYVLHILCICTVYMMYMYCIYVHPLEIQCHIQTSAPTSNIFQSVPDSHSVPDSRESSSSVHSVDRDPT